MFPAEVLPSRPLSSSYSIFSPSAGLCSPARSTAEMCRKTSLLPSSGWMKPKPEALIAEVYLAGTNTRRVRRALFGQF